MDYKKKAVILLLLASLLGAGYTAHATDWFAVVKFGLDVAAKAAARAVLRILEQRLISTIQGVGQGGQALFVQNWRNFQTSAQYRGEDIFRSMLASAKPCDYFSQQIKNNFNITPQTPLINANIRYPNTRTGNLDSFAATIGCTLPKDFDIQKYQKDFKGNGGWDAFARLAQPQNNYVGVLLESLNEVAKQRSLEESSANSEAVAGGGFTAARGPSPCLVNGPNGKCLIQGNILTPGSILGRTAGSVIDTDLKALTNADGASALISLAVDYAVNRLANLATSNSDNGEVEVSDPKSLAQEYCSADKPTDRAVDYVKQNYPQAYKDFPPQGGGGIIPIPGLPHHPGSPIKGDAESYCKQFRDSDNVNPYERCLTTCLKAVGFIPPKVSVPPKPEPATGGILACSVVGQGSGVYQASVQKAVQDVKDDPAYRTLLDTRAAKGNNSQYPDLNAFTQDSLDQVIAAVLSKLKKNVPDITAGRIYNSCNPGGKIGTDSILVGKRPQDTLGEVYDLKDGSAEDKGATLREALRASYGGERTSWDRLVP